MVFANIDIASSKNTKSMSESLAYLNADIERGAQLYDNWVRIKKVKINKKHPLYPKEGKNKGSMTWRCVECHGWDYLGNKGRYSKGPQYTGIKGILDAKNKTPQELFDILTNKSIKHDFSENYYLSYSDTWAIARFIREGLIDTNEIINFDVLSNANLANGGKLYRRYCMDCHGSDGNSINFREHLEGTHGIGWEANSDPQETLHKIRWGHPGADMPSMIIDENLSNTDIVDILSYCQTLFP